MCGVSWLTEMGKIEFLEDPQLVCGEVIFPLSKSKIKISNQILYIVNCNKLQTIKQMQLHAKITFAKIKE